MKLNELFMIYEMSTVGPKVHRFGIDIKLHILQPGDKQLPHGPRVKCIKRENNSNFSITLNENADKMECIGDYKELLSTKEFNLLFEKIKKYRIPFLNIWYDPIFDQDELRDQMDKIDLGNEVKLNLKVEKE